MKVSRRFRQACRAFTLVELLMVISVIAIMAALVIAAFSDAAQDTRSVLVRQQQAVVQEAVNSWIARETSTGRTNAEGNPILPSVAQARASYNAATTSKARLDLVQAYVDAGTYQHLNENTTDANKVQSEAMVKTGQYIEITDWPSGSYPKVNVKP